jgi:hypothetical protein
MYSILIKKLTVLLFPAEIFVLQVFKERKRTIINYILIILLYF